jgi:hypothetical protein
MHIPSRVPGLRIATVLVGLYAVVWISLEGDLWRLLLLSAGLSLVAGGYAMQRFLGGRQLSKGRWLLASAGIGFLVALSAGLLALLLMAVKTGLHSHGPEFSAEQLDWLLRQIPIWAIAGALAGLGLGLLAANYQGETNGRRQS